MHVAPAQQRRAPISLRPYYYHSSVFIDGTRDDISRLLSAFEAAASDQTLARPFELFKSIWAQHGWELVHLKVLDPMGREAFLDVMCRLFIETVLHARTPLLCAGGLFALYTFLGTQPRAPSDLFVLNHIPIAFDEYQQLLKFPETLEPPIRHFATKIIMDLVAKHTFLILPHSSTLPLNPRSLPTSVLAIESRTIPIAKKRGRPTRRDRQARADVALSSLEETVDRLGREAEDRGPSSHDYVEMKDQIITSVDSQDMGRAQTKTMERFRKLEAKLKSDHSERVLLLKAEAASQQPAGLLRLVHEPNEESVE
ncbi:hypothetical protein AURDEDRAFT_64224 [Auricularia subglabra TFB-10046 SS5]|nr:hypothetical protein AURDEDRAFT_64224 [Auricularia subglabra TFB-10046 SS5]